jgi:hypothetical protein
MSSQFQTSFKSNVEHFPNFANVSSEQLSILSSHQCGAFSIIANTISSTIANGPSIETAKFYQHVPGHRNHRLYTYLALQKNPEIV